MILHGREVCLVSEAADEIHIQNTAVPDRVVMLYNKT